MQNIGRKIVCEKEKTIQAAPRDLFPLLCPVLEEKWIPQWEYDLVYSKSGVNETGCIFRETMSGAHLFEEPVTATWITILHDPKATRVEFIIHYRDRAVARTSAQVTPLGDSHSRISWRKELTSTSPNNEKFTDQNLHDKMLVSLDFLADTLTHYCETGRMIAT
ncbi:MAG: hypothetical protein JEZ02_08370 [Desulfatibacillum sp.]|nr:hypothetical protein [Desulfatibacillum sp.]